MFMKDLNQNRYKHGREAVACAVLLSFVRSSDEHKEESEPHGATHICVYSERAVTVP
jgi:hypothetical protein